MAARPGKGAPPSNAACNARRQSEVRPGIMVVRRRELTSFDFSKSWHLLRREVTAAKEKGLDRGNGAENENFKSVDQRSAYISPRTTEGWCMVPSEVDFVNGERRSSAPGGGRGSDHVTDNFVNRKDR